MRIGFDAKRFFLNNSGLGNYSRNTIHYLNEYFPEYQYLLFTPSKGEKYTELINNNNQIIEPKSLISKNLKSFWRSCLITRDLVSKNIDLYHGLSNELPSGKKKIPYIVTIHDLIFLRYPELYPLIDRKIYNRKFKNACSKADVIIAISQQTKNDIINYYKVAEEKVKVLYQGCNPIYYSSPSEQKKSEITKKYNLPKNFILYVGTIEKRKNLLNVFKATVTSKIDFPIVVVGRPTDYIKEVKSFIRSNSLEKNVIFIHDANLYDLHTLYNLASLFVYPSVFEGFGIPILEALCSRTPVITSKGSCFSEAGGDNSVYTSPNDEVELGSAIKKVLSSKELQYKMIEKGIEHSKNFRGNVIAEKLVNLYNEII